MRGRTLALVAGLILALGLLACSDDDTDPPTYLDGGTKLDRGGNVNGDGSGGDFSSGSCTETTVADVVGGKFKDADCVILKDLVVTAVDGYGKYYGDVYAQDPKGGKSSGLKLYNNKRTDGKPVSELKPGDHIKVQGSVKYWHPKSGQFSDNNYPNKKSILEIEKNMITYITGGTAPTPLDVTAKDLTDASTAQLYEHVLVRVKNAAVTKVKAADPTYGNVDVAIKDATASMELRDDLYALSSLKLYGCHSFTGVISYFYGFRLQPRSSADLATGSGCPKPKDVTIYEIQDTTQANHPKEKEWVKVTGVITAVDGTPYINSSKGTKDYTGFWMQDEKGGAYSGIYVYHFWNDKSPAAETPKEGQKIELSGTYEEYYKLSELKDVVWTDKGTPSTAITPTAIKAADIGTSGSDGPKWESVLVSVSNLKADSLVTNSSGKTIGFKDSASGLEVVNTIFDFMSGTSAPKVGDSFSAVSGVVDLYKSSYQILPRKATDLMK